MRENLGLFFTFRSTNSILNSCAFYYSRACTFGIFNYRFLFEETHWRHVFCVHIRVSVSVLFGIVSNMTNSRLSFLLIVAILSVLINTCCRLCERFAIALQFELNDVDILYSLSCFEIRFVFF